MRNIWKRFLSMVLALALLIGMVPGFSIRVEAAQEGGASNFAGKKISILGDSISTYQGVSNNASCNSTIGGNAVYYSPGSLGVYQVDTWWQQVTDALGMELLVNNSWSGSCVLSTRSGTAGAYADRCVQLHDNAGNSPDVIAVFLGTNDFSYYQDTLGTAESIAYDSLITDNGDGIYTYAEPTTACEAYAIMLHKMTERYPDAEIYCMSLTARRDPDYNDSYADAGQPTVFNAELAEIIERFGCTVVDLENCGIDAASDVFDVYMGDKRVHPNALGMDLITEAVLSAMLGADTDIYDVSFDLTNVTGDGAHAVLPGGSYTAALTEADGFKNMTVTVTMGGVDITESCYADGVISIPEVTGDVAVTAEAMERDPLNFRWEFSGSELVTVTTDGNTENALTKLAGSAAEGVFSSTRYQLERAVLLRHDRSWVMEWKGTGKGGVMLSAESAASTGDPFFFRREASQMFAFGYYNGSQYDNYGITLPDTIDTTQEHTYRLENYVDADGSNMVYLYVDSVEIGQLNNYFIGGAAQGTTSDWISGKDFMFRYIGSSSHPLTNMSVEYLQIEEDSTVHHHGYTAVVTAPTCTEQGYTTRTCICGYSCVSDIADATGHTYQEADGQWVCHCGDIEKNGIVAENGSLFYYEHGKLTYAGLIYVDGYYYYVRSSGELVIDRTYWITKNNGLMESGAYQFDEQGRMILAEEPEPTVPGTEPTVPDETGPDDTEPEIKNGIVEENGSLYYYRDGKLYYAGLIYLDGYYYYVRGTGELVRNCSYWITKNNGLMESAAYEFDDQGRMILEEEPEDTESTVPETEPADPTVKNGIVEENGGLYYYKDGKLYYAGLIWLDGYYYYVRGTGELVVGRSYWVTKNNGLMESAAYEFDDRGRMILEETPETEPTAPADPGLKNGIVAENGSLYYYVDGKLTYAGLIYLDGYYYYVKGSGELVVGRSYWVTKNNGLMPSAMYTFDADGRMTDPPTAE